MATYKPGKLTKVEQFYIAQHYTSTSEDQLVKDINKSKKMIRAYIDTLPKISTVETKGDDKDTPLYKQFAQNGNGATIMTENASMMADDKRGEFTRKVKPDCVTSIRGNDG